MTDALIHLRVPATRKGRWVRASRADGLRLTDWITQIVEAHMTEQMLAKITIPEDVRFEDLYLARGKDGVVSFSRGPIERICEASGIDTFILHEGNEDNLSALIVAWYNEHLARGGARDPVQDGLIAEAAEHRHSLLRGRV